MARAIAGAKMTVHTRTWPARIDGEILGQQAAIELGQCFFGPPPGAGDDRGPGCRSLRPERLLRVL